MGVDEVIELLGGDQAAADRLGLGRTAIVMWRANGRMPLRHVERVAGELGLPVETVLQATKRRAAA
ncbi:MAG: hypothetical protein KGN77_02015 [Xanthomonadaceae bacterium]|nr:hypothetical protein [Xanthomonadaceae bacterium]